MASASYTSPRQLASVIGKLISMHTVMGPIVQLHTRDCLRLVASQTSWDQKISLSQGAIRELNVCQDSIELWNHKPFIQPQDIASIVYSDASDVGCAAVTIVNGQTHVAHQKWSPFQSQESSTYRELYTVYTALCSFGHLFKNTRVQWRTDNTGVVSIITKGSMKPQLHQLALLINNKSVDLNISLSPVWIPRDKNQQADALSRLVDWDDWAIHPSFFRWIKFKLQTEIDFDRFADNVNTQVEKFNSKYWVPGSAGVDALAQNWLGFKNWAVPPIALIANVINKIMKEKCCTLLVVPCWESAAFWPLLSQAIVKLSPNQIKGPLKFAGAPAINTNPLQNSIFGKKFKGNFLAVLFFPNKIN